MYLIAGLGNPGRKYSGTRHNIGFRVIKMWSESLGVTLKSRRFRSRNIRTTIHGKEVILLRPVTFMNRSGDSIKACFDAHQLETSHMLLIHDDLDLPVGRLKIVRSGGAGGHKGVASTILKIGSKQIPRLRIGIGRPRWGESVEDYVLKPFYRNQEEIITRVTDWAVRACELFVSEGVVKAMNSINCLYLADKEVIN
ncbi:aminoacyl-tRNA hydrolase [Thermodesulfobacteriota bacterium]